jgi:hypothetical protein
MLRLNGSDFVHNVGVTEGIRSRFTDVSVCRVVALQAKRQIACLTSGSTVAPC